MICQSLQGVSMNAAILSIAVISKTNNLNTLKTAINNIIDALRTKKNNTNYTFN